MTVSLDLKKKSVSLYCEITSVELDLILHFDICLVFQQFLPVIAFFWITYQENGFVEQFYREEQTYTSITILFSRIKKFLHNYTLTCSYSYALRSLLPSPNHQLNYFLFEPLEKRREPIFKATDLYQPLVGNGRRTSCMY